MHTLRHHARRCILPLAAVGALSAAVAAHGDSPVSGWVATYNWSDQYCWDVPSSKEPQCREPHAFVFHSLARTVDALPQSGCKADDPFREDLVERLMSLTYNWRETREAWPKYGACSNLEMGSYAGAIEFVDRRIQWPQAYVADKSGLEVSENRLLADLGAANPDVPAGAMALQCKGPWLQSVTFCMDSDFKYNASLCPAERKQCPEAIKLRGFRKAVD